jgi:hypothetical protein
MPNASSVRDIRSGRPMDERCRVILKWVSGGDSESSIDDDDGGGWEGVLGEDEDEEEEEVLAFNPKACGGGPLGGGRTLRGSAPSWGFLLRKGARPLVIPRVTIKKGLLFSMANATSSFVCDLAWKRFTELTSKGGIFGALAEGV